MILFNNCGEKILNFCLLKFENKIKTLPKDHPLQESARIELLKISMTLRSFLPIIEKANKAIFYFNGDYYEISKRICGIRYVSYYLALYRLTVSSCFCFKIITTLLFKKIF